jgi:hypothetical protein
MTRHAIDIDTSRFIRSHGRAPKGYGMWGFFVVNDAGKELDLIFAPAMNFGDAKVWAKAESRMRRYADTRYDLIVAP